MFGLLVVGLGDAAEHARIIAPITEQLSPVVQLVTPMPYTALQTMFDESAPWGLYNYEKAVYLEELTDGAIDVIVEHQARKVSPLSSVPVFVLGGAYARVDPNDCAFGGARSIRYVINMSATTPTADGFEAERQWSRDYSSALLPHAVGTGTYVNFMAEADEERVRSACGDKYGRLQEIKARYDPSNLFHLNPNVRPGVDDPARPAALA